MVRAKLTEAKAVALLNALIDAFGPSVPAHVNFGGVECVVGEPIPDFMASSFKKAEYLDFFFERKEDGFILVGKD